jgi:hypothetical protein
MIMAALSTGAGLALVLGALFAADLTAGSWAWGVVQLVMTFLLVVGGGELGRRRNLADAHRVRAATAA